MSAGTLNANPNVFDVGGLAALKRQVRDNDPKALKAAAQQFEALFLQMVLKSMRDAMPREGLFDNDQSRMYEALLDQQMAQVLGSRRGGTGLAALIEKQLARQDAEIRAPEGPLPLVPSTPGLRLPTDGPALPASALPTRAAPPAGDAAASTATGPGAATMREFSARVWPAATEAARATGIPAHFMVAQAALETGWGRFEPRRADGTQSFNVFGLKAGRTWSGDVVEAVTTEYVEGTARRQVERFRAYASYEDAFRDYARVLAGSPRYAAVLGASDAAGFAGGLARAGYATDPAYAAKLERVIGSIAPKRPVTG